MGVLVFRKGLTSNAPRDVIAAGNFTSYCNVRLYIMTSETLINFYQTTRRYNPE
jgi:hypothetical protein